jgi:hypothetical protein
MSESSYFQKTNPFEWSLIGFLEWRSENSVLKSCNKEHGAFRSLLQNIVAEDEDNIRTRKAQELLNNWQVLYFFCVHAQLMGQKPAQ